MAKPQLYDRIGAGYAQARQADASIFAQVIDALGSAKSVINVGAGTGNYEPTDRPVVAVEPNEVMVAQRSTGAPVVRAFAENLPVADQTFDAALAMFTIHHWPDREAGVRELGRVSKRQVALVYDVTPTETFWLADYFDWLAPGPQTQHPSAAWMGEHLQLREERIMWLPADCTDGFAGAYWNRPHRYLDPVVQAGMSILAKLTDHQRAEGTQKLQRALDSGEWDDRYGHLRDEIQFDAGYRLAICEW